MKVFSFLTTVLVPLAIGYVSALELVQRQNSAPQCSEFMCVDAVNNGATTRYTLQGLGKERFGWMAVGFGRGMTNSPMVIMWINSDNTITLSQRIARSTVEPSVDRSPPRVAVLNTAASVVDTNSPQLAFDIPSNTGQTENIIFAYGNTAPSSSATDARLQQHWDAGVASLSIAQSSSSAATSTVVFAPGTQRPTGRPNTGASGAGSPFNSSASFEKFRRTITAHAVCSALGFLIFLPLGALWARFARTFYPGWFLGHWSMQFVVAGIPILCGFILGLVAVGQTGGQHVSSTHKKLGVALFVLYGVQCSLGAFIHFVKDPNRKRRPVQNYVHAIFGLLIIALAFYQTNLGYRVEWPKQPRRGAVPRGVNTFFWIWLSLLIALYAGGLFFLRRQFRQERQALLKRQHQQHQEDPEPKAIPPQPR